MLCEASGEHALSWTAVFEWRICFKAGRVSVEEGESSERQRTTKGQKTLEKFENSFMKTAAEHP
jgi:hypothetical protein